MKQLGRLKVMVNNPNTWEAFVEYITSNIASAHATMEKSTDLPTIHREQGRVMMLRKLLNLREEVNRADGRQPTLFE